MVTGRGVVLTLTSEEEDPGNADVAVTEGKVIQRIIEVLIIFKVSEYLTKIS